jgi:hypothetical protein
MTTTIDNRITAEANQALDSLALADGALIRALSQMEADDSLFTDRDRYDVRRSRHILGLVLAAAETEKGRRDLESERGRE